MASVKDQAEELLHAIFIEGWKPTSRDIELRFGVRESSGHRIKREAKRIAAERGFLFGWDPDQDDGGHFRITPDNDSRAAERMLRYSLRQWRDAGAGAVHQFDGAHRQGFVSRHVKLDVAQIAGEFDARLNSVEIDVLGVSEAA